MEHTQTTKEEKDRSEIDKQKDQHAVNFLHIILESTKNTHLDSYAFSVHNSHKYTSGAAIVVRRGHHEDIMSTDCKYHDVFKNTEVKRRLQILASQYCLDVTFSDAYFSGTRIDVMRTNRSDYPNSVLY